ncbi:MAG: hypothetical protein GY797_04615 [Deltaproteobacteria bacterium]|nr:hypothetical protein [Deltaproteobacteria bacterium]
MNIKRMVLWIIGCMCTVMMAHHFALAQEEFVVDIESDRTSDETPKGESESMRETKNVIVIDGVAFSKTQAEKIEDIAANKIKDELKPIWNVVEKLHKSMESFQLKLDGIDKKFLAESEMNRKHEISLENVVEHYRNTEEYIRERIDEVIAVELANYLDSNNVIASRLSDLSEKFSNHVNNSPLEETNGYKVKSEGFFNITYIVILLLAVLVIIIYFLAIYKNPSRWANGFDYHQKYLKRWVVQIVTGSPDLRDWVGEGAKSVYSAEYFKSIIDNYHKNILKPSPVQQKNTRASNINSGKKEAVVTGPMKEVVTKERLTEWWNSDGGGSITKREKDLTNIFRDVDVTVLSYEGKVIKNYKQIKSNFEKYLIGIKDPNQDITYVYPLKGMTYTNTLGLEDWFVFSEVVPNPNTTIKSLLEPAILEGKFKKPVEQTKGKVVVLDIGN